VLGEIVKKVGGQGLEIFSLSQVFKPLQSLANFHVLAGGKEIKTVDS
jgi:hypothetical protein